MKLKPSAFTLVEILLVASLTALLSIAIFRSFSNGLKLWAKAERIHRESEAALLLDKMSEDLRVVTSISGIKFKGAETEFSFPAIVITRVDPKSTRASEEMVDQIGAVAYRFDPSQRVIFRRQANYSQALKGMWQEEGQPILTGIIDLKFHYQVSSDKATSLESAVDGSVPLGVVIDVRFSDDSGEHQINRYFPISIGA